MPSVRTLYMHFVSNFIRLKDSCRLVSPSSRGTVKQYVLYSKTCIYTIPVSMCEDIVPRPLHQTGQCQLLECREFGR